MYQEMTYNLLYKDCCRNLWLTIQQRNYQGVLLLNRMQIVQGSDTTMFNRHPAVGNQTTYRNKLTKLLRYPKVVCQLNDTQ